MTMSSRSISLDPSALSPKEYQSYYHFINQFNQFTASRDGRLRFAEAARFLRSYFPFDTEREDEIRSFFPQRIQLGEIDQGCVLAILRLLSHINNRKTTPHSPPFQLYRDLIFLQTDPLPGLPQPTPASINPLPSSSPPQSHPDNIKPSSQSSNPFRSLELINPSSGSPPLPPSKPSSSPPTTRSENAIPTPSSSSPTTTSLSHPHSAQDLHARSLPSAGFHHPSQTTSGMNNPFRQPLTSDKSNSNQNLRASAALDTIILTSPRIPPRPVISLLVTTHTQPAENQNEQDSHSQTPSSTKALPPPKHYSQRFSKHPDDHSSQADTYATNDPSTPNNNQSVSPDKRTSTSSAFISTPWKNIPKPKILHRLQVNPSQTNPVAQIDKLAHQDSAHHIQSSKHAPLTNSNEVRPNEPKHVSSSSPFVSSSEHSKAAMPPPPPPTKPMRPEKTENILRQQKIKAVLAQELANAPPSTLTRSQTFNHHRRVAPPLPPPRKRRDSLHVHNPNSVPLDQLVRLTCDDPLGSETWTTAPTSNQFSDSLQANRDVNAKRSVSNSASFAPPKYSNYQRENQTDSTEKEGKSASNTRPPRRTVSLLVEPKSAKAGTGAAPATAATATESVLDHLKALELGLRHDGKELVKEVKEGWRSRHGQRDERVPLVARKREISSTPAHHGHHQLNPHLIPGYNQLGNVVSRWKVPRQSSDDLLLDNDVHEDGMSSDSTHEQLHKAP